MDLHDGELPAVVLARAAPHPEARVGALVDLLVDRALVDVDLAAVQVGRLLVREVHLLRAHREVDLRAGLDVLVVEADDLAEVLHGHAAVVLVDELRHRPLEEVRVADERRHERAARRLVERGGLVDLLDLAAVHHRDAVREAHRLALVVRDVEERDADLVVDAVQLDLHVLPQLQVERGERLVEEQHLRLQDERAGDGDALLLAAGNLRGLLPLLPLHLDEAEHAAHALLDFVLRAALQPQAEGDVVPERQVREERVVLEDRVHAALVRRHGGHVLAVEENAARVRPFEAGQHAQERRLAAPARPEEREELAPFHVESDVVHGRHGPEAFRHALEHQEIVHRR